MPWTFAHAAAGLPFTRFCRTPFLFAALMIGTLSPDIPYYLGPLAQSWRTHSMLGIFTHCLPLGWAALLLLISLRRPVILLLPRLLRGALKPITQSKWRLRWVDVLAISVAFALGAATHVFWDAWTHRTGWFALRIPGLQAVWLWDWPGYRCLQHLSSLLGTTLLLWYFWRWQRKQPTIVPDRWESLRHKIHWICAATAVVLGLRHALPLANAVPTDLFWRAFLFQFATRSVSVFSFAWTLCALGFWSFLLARGVGQNLADR